jgi:hypothetical protein
MSRTVEHSAWCSRDHIGPLCSTERIEVAVSFNTVGVQLMQESVDAEPVVSIDAILDGGHVALDFPLTLAEAGYMRDALTELIARGGVR